MQNGRWCAPAGLVQECIHPGPGSSTQPPGGLRTPRPCPPPFCCSVDTAGLGSVIWPFSRAPCQEAWLGLLRITFDLRGAGGDFGMVPLGESVFRTQEGAPPGLPDQV